MNVNNKFVEENYKLIQYISTRVGSKLSKEEKEDLVNSTVVKLLVSDDEVLSDGASAYINRVMTNILIDKGRTDDTDALTHAMVSLDQEIDDTLDGDSGLTYHEVIPDTDTQHSVRVYRDDVHDLCSRLPPRQAEMFNMRYYLGMTQAEISEKLGLSINTVDSTLRTAKINAYKLIDEGD